MSNDTLYLKPNVVIEPLFQQWYAWSHLISPATAAMNITGRHLPIMDSYLSAPKLHAQAVANPKMRGGPFMDIDESRLADVEMLRANTAQDQQKLIDLAKDIKYLDHLLLAEAQGFGTEKLYEKVPEGL